MVKAFSHLCRSIFADACCRSPPLRQHPCWRGVVKPLAWIDSRPHRGVEWSGLVWSEAVAPEVAAEVSAGADRGVVGAPAVIDDDLFAVRCVVVQPGPAESHAWVSLS